MPSEKKIEEVQALRERIERSTIVIAADYRGLTVNDMVELRRAIRNAEGAEIRVVKNRLFRRACQEAEQPEMAELMDGPTAVIFGYEDVTAPVRAASEYMRTAKNDFALRMAVMTGQLLSAADLTGLASLPPREILAGQLARALQAPVANLVGLLDKLLPRAPGRLLQDSVNTFSGLLEARATQLEGA